MEPAEFRKILRKQSAEDIVENHILTDSPGPFTTNEALEQLRESMRVAFQVPDDQSLLSIVVGSAKLGFGLLEKPATSWRSFKPAYRSYQPGSSDIDIAIISPVIYGKIWQDLARLGAEQLKFPWPNKMSPHMFHGWIRPDKFPAVSPQRCNDWNSVVDKASSSLHFRYKKLRCGLYQSRYYLKLYQCRGVRAAQQAEETL